MIWSDIRGWEYANNVWRPVSVDDQGRLNIVIAGVAPGGGIILNTALGASENHIGQIGAHTATKQAATIRPNNTTAYHANDVLGTSPAANLTFGGCARVAGGSGEIRGALLIDSAAVATKPAVELWLFTANPTAIADHAAWAPTDAELLNLIGVIPFNTCYVGDPTAGAGGNCVFPVSGMSISFNCATGNTALYGVYCIRTAYVPIAWETFTTILRIAQD
jgi:hypothetical protein